MIIGFILGFMSFPILFIVGVIYLANKKQKAHEFPKTTTLSKTKINDWITE